VEALVGYGLFQALVLAGYAWASLLLARLSRRGQLAAHLGLLVVACLLPGKKAAVARQEARKRGEQVPRGRLDRWRARAMTDGPARGSIVALAVLAILAAAAEIPTMIPYLAAIGILGTTGLAGPVQAGVLAAYCLVMVAPAALLLAARMVTGTRLDGGLVKVGDFLEREAAETIGWLLGIAGFLIASRAGLELYG